jgi:SAM-dependent methyltransferase
MKGQCFDLTDRSGIKYDDWLGAFLPVLKSARTPVIDLGCGSGNDTLYLVENNIRVIPCDISAEIVSNIRRNFPELDRVEQFDMTHGLLNDGRMKRFFDEAMITHFFRGWELSGLSESVMHRYVKPKTLWTAMARPILP